MGDTDIGWTHRPGTRGRSWNPTQGCALKSEGCRNCYAMRMAARFAESGWSKGLINLKTRKWNGEARLAAHKLDEPLRWREPSTVFVNSMSDLFYEGFSNEQIAAVFGVMAACQQHTFLVLTKRARRMREWFEWIADQLVSAHQLGAARGVRWHAWTEFGRIGNVTAEEIVSPSYRRGCTPDWRWPLPNVWLGVSVENQDAADERIPDLLTTPAAVRFLSCEPLLGRLDFVLRGNRIKEWDEDWKYDTLRGSEWARPDPDIEDGSSAKLDWLITGCESGPGARSAEESWFRSISDQCRAAGVPLFNKQMRINGRVETDPARFPSDLQIQEWPQ